MKRLYTGLLLLPLLILLSGKIFSQEPIPKEWEQKGYVERGRYLVDNLAECVGCHTPLGPGGTGDSDLNLYLSGVPAKFAGAKVGPPQVAGFPGPKGAKYYPKNITPDPETGIGKWSEEQFLRAFKERTRPDGTKYDNSDMPWDSYKNMKEEDVRAIYRYLRTIKPINNKVPANVPPQ
ncbi:c-type cytochrome [bacterium]|nr:MAG: c-type cytochrome [bacterium]